MADNVLIASDITVELGSTYIGSAYSPQASVTQTDTGWELTITYADPDTPGELATLTIPVDSAGFGEVTASVESGHGNPQVTVTESGPDTAKSFHFAFSGIGGFSPTITVTEIEGGHSVTVTDVDGTESFDVLDGDPSQAIEDAERAAALANAAAATADASAAAADTATAAAQTATTAAQGATTAAQAATSAANTAATSATSAASAAQTATTAAQAATADAERAAARADTAADAAMAMVRNVPAGTLTDTVVTASDALNAPLLGATIYGTSTQDGTPTPSAPVAIESVNSVALVCTGKNLLDVSTETSSRYINVNGGESTLADWKHSDFIAVVPGVTYTFTPNSPSGGSAYGAWYADNDASAFVSTFPSGPQTVVAPDNARYVRLSYRVNSENVQFEVGSVATKYQPYITGTTTPIDLDGHELRSLPNGTRDELVIASDGSVTLVQRVGSQHVTEFDGINSGIAYATLVGGLDNVTWGNSSCVCDKLTNSTASTANAFKAGTNVIHAARLTASNTPMRCGVWLDGTQTTLDGYNSALTAMGGIDVLYTLAEPVIINLGTVTLPALPAPEFTAWADTDVQTTLAVIYERDISMALVATRDEALAAIAAQDGPVALANHAVGSYLTMGGTLYRVTTAIATGEAIVPGTNVQATTVMDEVIRLTQ